MKKVLIILSYALLFCATASAQVLQENELALVYYFPQTLMDIDITYTIETEETGPYCRYAEKYLGTTDVITANSQKAEIISVSVHPRSKADLNRPVKINAEDGANMQLLHILDNGVLQGYNLPIGTQASVPACSESQASATNKHDKPKQPITLPLLEEQLKASTPAQKADAVAKLIYRIREAKMYLLSGEIENAPADGNRLEIALKELSKQEKQLVQLFTGKRTQKTISKTITYLPTKSEEKPILYFSLENGITAEEDASALPIVLNFIARKQVPAPAIQSKKNEKKAPVPSPLLYNLPGTGTYTISYDGAPLLEGVLPIAQFGIAVPLPKNLFSGNKLPTIYFNTETGNIQTICHE